MGRKTCPVRQAQVVGGADMKRATDVQTGIGTKEHSTGVEQVQISARNLRLDEPVNYGWASPGNTAQNILDAAGASEGRTLATGEVKLTKAMKQIRATDLPDTMRNRVVGTGQGACHSHAAVQGDLRLAGPGEPTAQEECRQQEHS